MMTFDPHQPFEMPIEILDDDIDVLGHVNNTVYLRWVQNVAINHWYVIAPQDEIETLFWVIVRHEIDYLRPTFKDDEIFARTWIGRYERRRFERFTDIIRRKDNKILSKSRTLWCPVDQKSLKVARLTPEQIDRYSINDKSATK